MQSNDFNNICTAGYFERAMKAGVHGYLLKDSPSEDLAAAIRNVMKGKREVSQDLMFGLWQEQNPLSDREKEVLLLAKEGKTANEIAKALYLSPVQYVIIFLKY